MLIDCRLDRGLHSSERHRVDRAYGLLFVLTYGKIRVSFENIAWVAEKGDFIYIPPHTAYATDSPPGVFHEKYIVTLDLAAAPAGLPLFDDRLPRIAKPGRYEWMTDRLRVVHTEWQEQAPYANVRCSAILLELVALWSRDLEREPLSPSALLLAERMKAYIAGHYRERITKEDLAAAIGRSPNHAATLFKRTTGQTISEYAHAARIKTAVNMLKQSRLTAGEIAEYLGYRDLSYFHRIFKKLTGYAPAHFMNERDSRE